MLTIRYNNAVQCNNIGTAAQIVSSSMYTINAVEVLYAVHYITSFRGTFENVNFECCIIFLTKQAIVMDQNTVVRIKFMVQPLIILKLN